MSVPSDYEWLIDRLLRYEQEGFYGNVTLSFRNGEMSLFRYEMTEANPMKSGRKNRHEETARV